MSAVLPPGGDFYSAFHLAGGESSADEGPRRRCRFEAQDSLDTGVVPYRFQGDAAWDRSSDAVRERRALRQHPALLAVMETFWGVLCPRVCLRHRHDSCTRTHTTAPRRPQQLEITTRPPPPSLCPQLYAKDHTGHVLVDEYRRVHLLMTRATSMLLDNDEAELLAIADWHRYVSVHTCTHINTQAHTHTCWRIRQRYPELAAGSVAGSLLRLAF